MADGFTKDELGINGIHGDLGRQLSEAEFKGFMSASVRSLQLGQENIADEMRRMENRLNEKLIDLKENKETEHAQIIQRVNKLEGCVEKVEGFQNKLLGLAIAAGIGVEILMRLIFK
jgi:hypothetical protein